MNKRILIITDNLPDQINGVVTTFKNIEIEAKKENYEIVYLTPKNFFHFNAPSYPEIKLSLAFFIGKKIEKLNPDFIHIATEGPIGLASKLWLDRKRWNYNTSYHTKFPEYAKKIYNIPLEWTYSYMRWFHKHSGTILTTTNTMVQDLKDNDFTGNIISWTRGVDRQFLNPTRQRVIINKKNPIVLYVGRLSKEKNVELVCKLSSKKYTIIVIGDGPIKNDLEKKYPHVYFLGYKTGSELANYYQDADVFCFPSITDTFGIVMIESMSLGTPVAAFPVPGPKDIIKPGVTGHMSWDLEYSIDECLHYQRDKIVKESEKWTWQECWSIFKNNLVHI